MNRGMVEIGLEKEVKVVFSVLHGYATLCTSETRYICLLNVSIHGVDVDVCLQHLRPNNTLHPLLSWVITSYLYIVFKLPLSRSC